MEQIAIKKDGKIFDMQSADELNIKGEPIYFSNEPQALNIIRHSSAHLLAQAIKELYPEAKFFVGPVVDEGFYYDFKVSSKISEEDLKKIELKMKELAEKKLKIQKYELNKEEALKKYNDDELKKIVLNNIKDEKVGFYKQGDFEDLCKGPHLPNTKFLKNIRLTKLAGAYLGGDSSKEMLTRIYGISFADKDSLKKHMNMLEEAKKRDHRKIANEISLFNIKEEIGAGLVLWLPNGAKLRNKLETLLFKAHRKRGYQPVKGPQILKSSLWKTSGHYENYKENMYFTCIDEQEYGMKPMNCLGHIKVYESSLRSYKELPLKFFEYGLVHRHELSGVMHGLFRVREFTQDDAHIFCMPSQIKSQILEVIEFVDKIMNNFEFKYEMTISTKPNKYIGGDEIWQTATKALEEALNEKNLPYTIDEGGGAFYGPKIDIQITDAIGRKWQCSTIQIDFNLPMRFNLEYVNEDNKRLKPVMIHRAILGSFERFIGILTEHFAGEFPFFIAPIQVILIPINDKHNDYCKIIAKKLLNLNIDYEIYEQNESLNKRIRTAEKQKAPLLVIIGDKEVKEKKLSIRDRKTREQYLLFEDDFLKFVKDKNDGVLF